MNGFDDFDTKVTVEEFYADLLAQAEYHETHKPKPARKGHVLESLMGGKYHGPSNEAGLTAREYWESMDEYRDEQARLRDEW